MRTVLFIVNIMALLLLGCSYKSENTGKHFIKSMEYSSQANKIINKGSAFSELVNQYQLDAALYIGDDTTDVDAFDAARSLREAGTCYGIALGVFSDDTPRMVVEHADLMLDGIHSVEVFLSWVLSAVRAS